MRALLRQTTKKMWLTGCSTAVIGFALTTMVIFWLQWRKMGNYILDAQVPVPTVAYTRSEAETLRQKAESFYTTVDEGKESAEITLTVLELNQLIQSQPETAEWANRVYVQSIDKDEIVLQVSIPFEAMDIDSKHVNGKFLTGNIHAISGIHNGRVKLHFLRFERDGEVAPFINKPIADMLDIEKWRENEPKVDALLERVEVLELLEGKIRVRMAPGHSGE